MDRFEVEKFAKLGSSKTGGSHKKRFTEEQITYALKRHESGVSADEICREMGVSSASFYKWKKKYAGMGISELRQLKSLEDENRRLKRLVADLSLDKHMLQEVLSKKF